VSCAADLVHTAINNPEVVCLYVTLSRNNAKKIIWPELKRINRRFSLKLTFNESDLSAHASNGSIIYCSGASDRTEIEKFRGLALKKVYIDEGQSFPNYIVDLIDDVLTPALMDYAGSLSLIGTPPPIPAGFFHKVATEDNEWSKHHWTFFDNPHILDKSGTTHQALLDRELKRRGVSLDHPSIQREWMGKWANDTDSLVYHYDSEKNGYTTLPQAKWTYMLGVDIGYEDADALAVIAFSETDPNTYLVEETVTKRQGLTELVEQIESVRKKYAITKIVMDTGGLGKKIAEEIIRRYKIPVIAAEKVRKVEYIELMNDALRSGRLRAKAGSRFAQDAMKVEWDLDKSTPDKRVISKRFHSDICEALLYVWRDSWSFTYEKPKQALKYGTKQWQDEEAIRLEEEAEKFFLEQEEANKDPF